MLTAGCPGNGVPDRDVVELGGTTMTPDGGAGTATPADPVFVLCAGRSGSTLLRFLLDAHPDLVCRPENGLPDLCGMRYTNNRGPSAGSTAANSRIAMPADLLGIARRDGD